MEKRGVVTDDEKTKTASTEMTCPQCGASIEDNDYCAVCGTLPFEKRRENAEKDS